MGEISFSLLIFYQGDEEVVTLALKNNVPFSIKGIERFALWVDCKDRPILVYKYGKLAIMLNLSRQPQRILY